jgi:hypothetical protein
MKKPDILFFMKKCVLLTWALMITKFHFELHACAYMSSQSWCYTYVDVLHLYSSEVRIEGLETLDYLDNLSQRERFTEQGDAITFESEVHFFCFVSIQAAQNIWGLFEQYSYVD